MKKINGTTAIVLIMALFFASCGDGDDTNNNHHGSDNIGQGNNLSRLPMIEGGGLSPWTLNGVPLRGTKTSEPIHINNTATNANRLTAEVTMTDGFITAITVVNNNTTYSGGFDFDSLVPPVTYDKATFTTSNILGVPTDTYTLNLDANANVEDRVNFTIERMKLLNTWEITSNVNSAGAAQNGGVDIALPRIESTEVEDGNNQIVNAVTVSSNTLLRSIKYAVKEAVNKIAYGTIENSNPDNFREGIWTYNGNPINGTASVVFKGYMGSGPGNGSNNTAGRQDYPFSDNHTVTVTLDQGVITRVDGTGSDYGCPWNGSANNGWTAPGFQMRNMQLRMLGRDSESTNNAGSAITVTGENNWNVDVLATASQSKLYLRSAVYEAIKIIARENQ